MTRRAALAHSLVTLLGVAVVFAYSGPARAQMVQFAAGAGTMTQEQGALVGLYQADVTTHVGFSYASGLHPGVNRQAQRGTITLTAGDSMIPIGLPTDMDGGTRVIPAQGLLLNRRAGQNTEQMLFLGMSGSTESSAFLPTVMAAHSLAIASGHRTAGSFDWSGLVLRGEQSSMLCSGSWSPNREETLAGTVGTSAGSIIGRATMTLRRAAWELQAGYFLGALQLQPESSLASMNLERTGFNARLERRLGDWLQVEGARHEYVTTNAQQESSLWKGITAATSNLLEAGANAHWGALHAGGRVLQSSSGSMRTSGSAIFGGWNAQRWSLSATSVRSKTTGAVGAGGSTVTSRNTNLEATGSILPRLSATMSAVFQDGLPNFDFGGTYDSNKFSLAVAHQEAFVPFGVDGGFHRMMTVRLRFYLHDHEVTTSASFGGGVPATVMVSTNGYYGQPVDSVESQPRMPGIPKYLIRGVVLTMLRQPVRGAAVVVGDQIVYTDSEGDFSVRFTHDTPVRVGLQPSAFLTSQQYRSLTAARMVLPRATAGEQVELEVEPCHGCQPKDPDYDPLAADASEAELKSRRTLQDLVEASRAMASLRGQAPR